MMPTVTIDRIARSALQLLGLLAVAAVGSSAMLAPVWSLPYIPASMAAWWWLRRIERHALAHPATPQPPAMPDVPPALAALLAISTLVPPSGPPSSGAKLDDPGFASPRRFWAFTAPRALATVAQIVIQRLDIVLVAIIRGPVEAAVYAAATRFLVVGQLGNGALIQASQPQFSHLFSVGDLRAANTVYQATTAWLILLTWPLYLLAAIYGPEILAIFGHSYRAGSSVMIILSLTMIVATGCGQVDMVLTTAGRSSWSLLNGLLAVSINVAVDLALIPRYGITGAAIGWAAAIVISNLIPLFQVTWIIHVHPFGRGFLVASLLTALSFAAIPLALRAALGTGSAVSIAGVAVGCIVQAAGLWKFHGALKLAVFPGMSSIARRARRRRKPVTGPQPDIGHGSLRR